MNKRELLRHPLIEAGAISIGVAVSLLVYAQRLQQEIDANNDFLSKTIGTSFHEHFYEYITFQNSSLRTIIQLTNITSLILSIMGVFLCLLFFGLLAFSQRIRLNPKFEPHTEIDLKISQQMSYKRDFFVAFVVLVVGLGLYLYSTNEINSEIEAWPYRFPSSPLTEWSNIQTWGIIILGFGIALFIWYAVKHWINEKQLRDMKKALEA